MKTAALLLTTTLALAGCVSGDPELEAADACAGTATATGNDATASATCDGASASANGASSSATSTGKNGSSSASASSTGATTTLVPFNAEGNTYNGIYACAVILCQGTDLPTSGTGPSWFEPELHGTLLAAELTLTWTPTTPLTDELLLGIAYETEEGVTDFAYATGTSPLTLSETTLNIPADKVLGVYVNPYKCLGAAIAIACYGLEQTFTIEGTLTTNTPTTEATATATATTQP